MKHFLTVLVLVACFTGSTSASGKTSKKWMKMNPKGPVCFGTRDHSFGYFNYFGPDRNASAFMLKHVSGWVSCSGHGRINSTRSNWGCLPYTADLSTAFTDCMNKIIAPLESPYARWHHKSWYKIDGYTSSSKILVFPVTNGDPKVKKITDYPVKNTGHFRLWYVEDLFGYTESDNSGKTCADVYMYA